MNFRTIISKIPFAKYLYRKYHIEEKIRLFRERKQMSNFAQKGDGVIEHIHSILKQSERVFFIDAGTLIGIYRDGHLLKRDMDIDMAVKVNCEEDIFKVRKLLQENGCILKIMFSTHMNGIIQDAFDYNGVRIDVSYFKSSSTNDFCYILYDDNKIAKMTFSQIKKTKLYKYKDLDVYIPEDSDKYLEERYGKSWRTPDPYFKYWEAPCVTTEEGRGICEFNK